MNTGTKTPGTGSREISRFQFRVLFLLYALLLTGFLVTGFSSPHVCRLAKSILRFSSYNKDTVVGTAASRAYFHLNAEAVRMGE